MEKTEITKEQEKKLVPLIKERSKFGVFFFIIGLTVLVTNTVSYIVAAAPFNVLISLITSSISFFIIGFAYWSHYNKTIKLVEAGDYKTYKTVCRKVGWEYASVDNNEVLSKRVKRSTKRVVILGSRKSMQAGDEIGILKAGKEFMAFPLNICITAQHIPVQEEGCPQKKRS